MGVCSLAGQCRKVESSLLSASGKQTPQAGGDHTWEYLNFNQKKSLESVWTGWVEAMGSDQEPDTDRPRLMGSVGCCCSKSLLLGDMNVHGAQFCPMGRNPHIMIPSLSMTPTHKCQHLQGGGLSSDLKTSALYNNTALRSSAQKAITPHDKTPQCNRGR